MPGRLDPAADRRAPGGADGLQGEYIVASSRCGGRAAADKEFEPERKRRPTRLWLESLELVTLRCLGRHDTASGMATPNGGERAADDDVVPKLHAVVVPFPLQGHVTPALQLAKKLVKLHGFRVTFVNTTYIHERLAKSRGTPADSAAAAPEHEGIEFVHVPDGLPDGHPRHTDVVGFTEATLKMGPVLESLLSALQARTPATLVIRDANLIAAHHVARKLRLPVAAIFPCSAVALQCTYSIDALVRCGVLPIDVGLVNHTYTTGLPESYAEAAARAAPLACLPGVSPTLRVQDLPTLLLAPSLDDLFIRFYLDHHNPLLPESDCIIYNSFHALEGPVLDAAAAINPKVFAVGPLALEAGEPEASLSGTGGALWEEDPTAIPWLDAQQPRSVLFVSFGSMVTASVEQMREFALGLESSGVPFLWVIRLDLVADDACGFRAWFAEFVARTRARSLLVPWAPQAAVLSHPATGAFLTHCGWNSTLESVSCGVPMLAWPRFADHTTNAHYIVQVWKIGFELAVSEGAHGASVVARAEVAAKVRKLMVADPDVDVEVATVRANAATMKAAAHKAVGKGGSSQVALSQFVDWMLFKRNPDAAAHHKERNALTA